ncbi:hypothetical protein HJC23_004958 [Cyclotella cryptica]|uniref:Mitochondrial carrier n=1 Tax=Cyclotella cryptica TaxID=29204 RepID=A0ABD3P8W7_9STRA|eukprot:CCRYP_016606-RA/>CCRYP_016606-RA protein AED:0.09 eAED:0.09 QI:219/1/1/1/1/1/3/307/318
MLNEAWVDFAAGWISGGISVLVCQPVDTVLTRLQATSALPTSTTNAGFHTVSTAAGGTKASSATVTLGPSAIVRGMISNFGVTSLWRGSSAMIGAVPVQNALLMTGYGVGKRYSGYHDEDGKNGNHNVLVGVFVGGCTGGILQSFVMSPVELIKVTQQVIGKSMSSATTNVASGLFSRSGAWKGLGATLLRDGIPHGVWFVSYDYAKTELTSSYESMTGEGDWKRTTTKEIAIPMVSGAFAATTAWLVGYPFDLIKTRIQAGTGHGVISTARDLVRESGGRVIHGLYRGFTLKLLRSIPASAIGFLTYETAAKVLSGR